MILTASVGINNNTVMELATKLNDKSSITFTSDDFGKHPTAFVMFLDTSQIPKLIFALKELANMHGTDASKIIR